MRLPKQLADMIAAGEVVERPASVIKELAENAFDSGASAVTIEIRDGGLTFMRVSDNGCGIERGDVKTAFLRHATSKLRDARGLEAIGTLGFRGEALAAIASVSKVEMLTRTGETDDGTLLMLDGGEETAFEPVARPVGTTVTVRDLFYNTPARQKFMKTNRAEAAAITQAVIRLALSRPDVSVRYLRDGNEELYTPGDSRIDSCLYAALGRDFAAEMLPAESELDGVRVRGYVSAVEHLRGNRNYQFFLINGRHVKSRVLQAALEQAYRNRMFTGRYPACALYVELGYAQLDVNVHPAKTEVRFLYEKQVFDAVYSAAMSALDGAAPPVAAGAETIRAADYESQYMRQSALPRDETAATASHGYYRPAGGGFGGPRDTGYSETRRMRDIDYGGQRQSGEFAPRGGGLPGGEPRPGGQRGFATDSGGQPFTYTDNIGTDRQAAQTEITGFPARADYRVVGEVMETYIVVEARGSLWLIDKHAAHERIHFDRMQSGNYDPMPQMLLAPVVVKIGGDGAQLLLENSEILSSLGFAVEPFGLDAVAVRSIPSAIDPDDAEPVLADAERELRLGAGGDTRPRDEIYASLACRAAIKAGRNIEPNEQEYLAEQVMNGAVRYCPHGRPVAMEITKSYIDKSFKRE